MKITYEVVSGRYEGVTFYYVYRVERDEDGNELDRTQGPVARLDRAKAQDAADILNGVQDGINRSHQTEAYGLL